MITVQPTHLCTWPLFFKALSNTYFWLYIRSYIDLTFSHPINFLTDSLHYPHLLWEHCSRTWRHEQKSHQCPIAVVNSTPPALLHWTERAPPATAQNLTSNPCQFLFNLHLPLMLWWFNKKLDVQVDHVKRGFLNFCPPPFFRSLLLVAFCGDVLKCLGLPRWIPDLGAKKNQK